MPPLHNGLVVISSVVSTVTQVCPGPVVSALAARGNSNPAMGAEPSSRQLVGPDPLPHHHRGHTRPAARSSQPARTFPRRRDPQPLTVAPHRPRLTVVSSSVLCTLAGRRRTACRRWLHLRRCGAAATETPSLTNAEPSDALGAALCSNQYQTDRGWTWRAEPWSRRCAGGCAGPVGSMAVPELLVQAAHPHTHSAPAPQ